MCIYLVINLLRFWHAYYFITCILTNLNLNYDLQLFENILEKSTY